MTIATAEKKLDGVEQEGNSSDDGDIQMQDASNDQISATASTPSPECTSASGQASPLPSSSDGRQDPQENGSNSDLMTPSEWKKKGNEYFGAEDWNQALHAYYSGLSGLLEQRELTLREKHEGNNISTSTSSTAAVESNLDGSSTPDPLEVALRSNIAFVLIKLQRYDRAQEECNQLLLISPSNCKALYRRACAREGLYFMETPVTTTNGSQPKDRMVLLREAIQDLERALLCVEKEQQNEEKERQSSTNSSKTNGNNNKKVTYKNGRNPITKQCQRSLDRLKKEYDRQEKISISESKTPRSEQKRDVLRLLLARHQNGQAVLHGEAFFLLEWNWWVRWCRYVDFFDVATNELACVA